MRKLRRAKRPGWMCRHVLLLAGSLTLGCAGGSAPPSQAPAAEAVPAEAPAAAEESQSLPAGPPPPAPAPAPAPAAAASEPARGDALDGGDELARAEQELAAADRELSAANAESKPAKSEQHEGAPGRGAGAAKPKSSAPSQNACVTTCKAFASLVRARDSICRIAGDDGERCTHANEIVERHTPRSTSCGCSS